MTDGDLEDAFRDVILAMTMLSNGTTQAWDKSGANGKPGSRILTLIDRPIADVYSERWERANGPTSQRQILHEARVELEQWRGWGKRDRPDALTPQQEENLILEDGKGFDALLVAQRFRTSATRVRKVRKAAGVSPDTGELERGSDREETAAVLESKGMAQRHIAALLDMSQPTVHRMLAQRKMRLKRAA